MPELPGDTGFIHVVCPVCGSDDARVRWFADFGTDGAHLDEFLRCTNTHYGRFGRIVRCRRCGMIYRDPQEEDPVSAYAATADEDYLAERPARRATFARTLKQLHRFIQPPGELLDVGCSTGFFLCGAREAGWHATGLEPSRWAVACARAEGLEVIEGTLDSHPFAPAQFDVVALWDVIEHVRDLPRTLQAAHELLRPGGVLALTTMDSHSLVARALGARWPHLMRMHLWYFGRRHMARLLETAGFERPHIYPHVRVLSADYLTSRLAFLSGTLARGAGAMVRALRLEQAMVPIQLGDLVAFYARKPAEAERTEPASSPAAPAPADRS